MANSTAAALDVLICGGGAAGLWLLDRLVRAGRSVRLIESAALGAGQTVASQGIIHGGLKYTLDGLLHPSAAAVRDMPAVWRRCLAGEDPAGPDLRATQVRAECCHLWRTDDLLSRMALVGARAGLAVTPRKLDRAARPPVLADCPAVFELPEQVIDPRSFIADLARQHAGRCLAYDFDTTRFEISDGALTVALSAPAKDAAPLRLTPRVLVLTAGAGNAAVRARLGMAADAMQRRPLHMTLLRGALPPLNGHCVDRAHTRVTVTTAHDQAGRTIWQVGGQIAEDGVALSPAELIGRARRELEACIPGIRLGQAEWATYRVDRAEPAAAGKRPSTIHAVREGSVITAWPTKLALVPLLVDAVAGLLDPPTQPEPSSNPTADWPTPPVATPPWEEDRPWTVAP